MATIQYRRGTQAKYDGLTNYSRDIIYFLEDSNRIMLGETDVTKNIVLVTNFEGQAGGVSAENAFEGKLYINASTLECRIKDSDQWVSLIPGYITVGADVANEANNAKVATVKALREFVVAKIAEIGDTSAFVNGLAWTAENGTGTGKLVVTKGTETLDVVLDGIPFKIDYEEATYSLKITSYGSETPKVIQLPKPGGIKSGRYEASYTLPDGTTGPALVLTITNDDGDSEVVIPAAELVVSYTGGSTDTIVIEVAANNTITGTVKIDPEAGNALVKTANGLKVDLSGKLSGYGAGEASELLISDATGNAVARSGKTILAGTEMGESTDVLPTAAAVATAISAAVTVINGEIAEIKNRVATLENAMPNKMDKMAAGNANEVVVSAADGTVARSAKVIGGATLEANPAATVLATEAAVDAAMKKAVEDATPEWGEM